MARNIEIKARIESVTALAARAAALATEGPVQIAQDDTFFRCSQGRLKLRAFSADAGELIFYRRADRAGPKESFYVRSPTASPDSLREALALAHGELGRVQKQRTLYLAGRTRIHLDVVAGLGHFLELEVVLADDEPAEAGTREAAALMAQLGVASEQLVEGAYLDLLMQAAGALDAPGLRAARHDTAADEAAIREARRLQTLALAAGDLDTVASFWTPDVTIRRGLGHAVAGAAAARALLEPDASAPTAGRLIYQREALAVQASPHWPLAFEEGRWSGHAGSAQAAALLGGRYAAQWVRRDGRWLIRSEVFVALTCEGAGCGAMALP